ncbi:hypothetical protein LUX03_23250 [Streptomyces sudanensis]|nr:hypothetical protein [Streptomyces sudanensis]
MPVGDCVGAGVGDPVVAGGVGPVGVAEGEVRPGAGRSTRSPVSTSTTVNVGTGVGAGTTTTTSSVRKPAQVCPTTFSGCSTRGRSSGLPQAQRTRGTPYPSTSTAVPAWSTAWYGTAPPSS